MRRFWQNLIGSNSGFRGGDSGFHTAGNARQSLIALLNYGYGMLISQMQTEIVGFSDTITARLGDCVTPSLYGL